MTLKEMERKAQEIKELIRMKEELEAEIEAAQNELKGELEAQGVDMMTAGAYKISWKTVTSSRMDTTALKKELPELAAHYMKQTTTRRFLIN